ncbi:MAG: hypothetical protein BWK73_06860 [Thiothrix lacustris]|uniref:Uncharacterized protein n=1 Tax=Thiothrix lacustris TaxID=525917 RepID=A0A1Y1QX11_9GAMM|nr:MAG: hypothetical protein BWK73_06860 [Thiothrix lacustris]
MNVFFQWIRRWFSPRKISIESKPVHFFEKESVNPIDKTHEEIESTCHQIEQSIENIRSDIRSDKSNAGIELLRCEQLIAHLESAMHTQQSLDSK